MSFHGLNRSAWNVQSTEIAITLISAQYHRRPYSSQSVRHRLVADIVQHRVVRYPKRHRHRQRGKWVLPLTRHHYVDLALARRRCRQLWWNYQHSVVQLSSRTTIIMCWANERLRFPKWIQPVVYGISLAITLLPAVVYHRPMSIRSPFMHLNCPPKLCSTVNTTKRWQSLTSCWPLPIVYSKWPTQNVHHYRRLCQPILFRWHHTHPRTANVPNGLCYWFGKNSFIVIIKIHFKHSFNLQNSAASIVWIDFGLRNPIEGLPATFIVREKW